MLRTKGKNRQRKIRGSIDGRGVLSKRRREKRRKRGGQRKEK